MSANSNSQSHKNNNERTSGGGGSVQCTPSGDAWNQPSHWRSARADRVRRPLIPSRLTPASIVIGHRRVVHNRSSRLAKGPPHSVTSPPEPPPEPHSDLALQEEMRSDVEGLTNDQAVESKAQLIHHIYPSTSRRSSTEMQWHFVRSEEHQGLRPYNSKTPA